MSMIDVLTRVDSICNKYDADKHRCDGAAGDPFSRLYAAVDTEIDAALEKSERATREKNRAAAVDLNADVRRTKARLMDEAVKLQKIVAKKVKGLSPEEKALRSDLVAALPHRIQAIPGRASSSILQLKLMMGATTRRAKNQSSSEESTRCGELNRAGLISQGLDTLKDLDEDMNEGLDRQVPLMDEIDSKVDKADSELRKTNVRLK